MISLIIYVESKKYNKLVNIIKKNQIHGYREQTRGYQWGEGRVKSNTGKGLRGTNDYPAARIHGPTQGICPVFYNN